MKEKGPEKIFFCYKNIRFFSDIMRVREFFFKKVSHGLVIVNRTPIKLYLFLRVHILRPYRKI